MADIVLVSLGSTAGLWAADQELAAALGRAGASVAMARSPLQPQVRTLALTDWRWARGAREAARAVIAAERPRAVVYSTITAALLWPTPGAIRFDALAQSNRPGRHGVWQRRLERRRLREATLLLPWSGASLAGAPQDRAQAVVVPVAVETSGAAAGARDIAAITYAANPSKKGLDRVLAAWSEARRDGEELVVAGLAESIGEPGVRSVGVLDRDQYRALLRRARVYVTAPRREDYGIAQLEALADGCMLVTSVAPGPYAALALARALDERLVGEDLATALRTALDEPRVDYAAQAQSAIEPFSRASVDRVVAEQVLPRLLA
jgi:hypothetical protein